MSCNIPHIIHYCWFGENEKPELVKKCINSWIKFFPDWEIKEWNESNYDVNKVLYMKEAYEAEKWAFVSDYARFDILYEYGGVYLDVDVEFLKPLPQEFLEKGPFTGFEYTKTIAPGLIFAVNPKNDFVKKVLEDYLNARFVMDGANNYVTVNKRLEELMKQDGFIANGVEQTIMGITVYPSEYFCGYNSDIRELEITEKTICCHHYLGSWREKNFKIICQNILKKLIGIKVYKKVVLLKRFINEIMK